MRITLAAGVIAAALLGCNTGDKTARVGGGVDTVVTSRQTQDTAVVTTDTTMKVDVDTNMDRGDRSTRVDTVAKKRGSTRADTTR
jgi:hypothetical protein